MTIYNFNSNHFAPLIGRMGPVLLDTAIYEHYSVIQDENEEVHSKADDLLLVGSKGQKIDATDISKAFIKILQNKGWQNVMQKDRNYFFEDLVLQENGTFYIVWSS